jgi:hypothetical protein
VSEFIALMVSAKCPLQISPFLCWVKKVCGIYGYSLGLLPFPLYILEAADKFKTKTKTKVQYNNNNNNNNAKEQILVKHHLFI